jgi:DNA-binding CsgD family transcriptional regulator/3D (Asp-Asp-Asp) domain-containing protein
MLATQDISNEFFITRHLNGVQLLRPENFHSRFDGIGNHRAPMIPIPELLSMPCNIFFKNLQHIHQEVNEAQLTSFGIQSKEDALGVTISKFAANQQDAMKVLAHDDFVIKSNSFLVVDEQISLINLDLLQAISFKFPWYNDHNKIIGTFGCAIIVKADNLSAIARQMAMITDKFLLNTHTMPTQSSGSTLGGWYFSARELEVMRWVVRGKTMREIAAMMGLSRRTVEAYFVNIKIKAGVTSKSQLIAKAIDEFLL